MTYHSTTALHVLDVNDDFYLHGFGFESIFCHSLVILLAVNVNSVTDTVIEWDCHKYQAWVPREMVEAVRPDLVLTYKGSASSMCHLTALSLVCSFTFHLV
jgi:hypothetical protein